VEVGAKVEPCGSGKETCGQEAACAIETSRTEKEGCKEDVTRQESVGVAQSRTHQGPYPY
jgi:hypothetical protein